MNRFFTLLLAASCLTAVGQLPDYVPTDSLVGWYSFENDFLDHSGNGNHGIPNGDVPFSSGLNGDDQSMSIDEAGSYVHLEGLDDFDFANESITFSAWVNWTGQLIFEGDIIRYDDCSSSGYIWGVSLHQTTQTGATNTLKAFDHNRFGADNSIEVSNTLPPVNLWSHVVCVRDVDLGRNQLFRDGVLIGQTSSITTPVSGLNREMLLGICGGYESTTFFGAIDECGIWNRALSVEEIQVLFSQEQPTYGCMDSSACNFSAAASSDDGSCTYGCGFCGQGTIWDEASQTCIPDNPSDLNYDGCVDVNDFMGHLAAFGLGCEDGVAETPWQCGDPLEYQGYDYATVQIGEQCWFAENLRAEMFNDGSEIPQVNNGYAWSNLNSGAWASYPDYAGEFGYLYNWWGVIQSDGLCPTGWQTPSASGWQIMVDFLGGNLLAGNELKSSYGWGEEGGGNNGSGFGGLPGGMRNWNGTFNGVGYFSGWWTSTSEGSGMASHIQLTSYGPEATILNADLKAGRYVRCLKDEE